MMNSVLRAIIRQPTILLLDEATSALDSVNEKEVQKALDAMLLRHQGVAIVIAHRLTTVKNCDKIVCIDKGVEVEQGSHMELMAIDVVKEDDDDGGSRVLKGHYHLMWDTQMGEETFADAKVMSDDQLADKLRSVHKHAHHNWSFRRLLRLLVIVQCAEDGGFTAGRGRGRAE